MKNPILILTSIVVTIFSQFSFTKLNDKERNNLVKIDNFSINMNLFILNIDKCLINNKVKQFNLDKKKLYDKIPVLTQRELLLKKNLKDTSTIDYFQAPNSYIYDIEKAKQENLSGIYIPVRKAYEMWEKHEYLQKKAIPYKKYSVSVYWEDTPGLIDDVELLGGIRELGQIKVMINNSKGKGNALIALHVGDTGTSKDTIYWTWHIWVVDDPSQGAYSTLESKYTLDRNGNEKKLRFMDRNLGATASSFLGYNWAKNVGLIYQWGRKDPFPPLVGMDYSFYWLQGSFSDNIVEYAYARDSYQELRKYDNIEENIQYSIHNPIMIINPAEVNEHWFSKTQYRDINKSFDLWGDTNEGKDSFLDSLGRKNKYSQNFDFVYNKSDYKYKNKSSFDPCPEGWRVPSFSSSLAEFGVNSPWGDNSTTRTSKSWKTSSEDFFSIDTENPDWDGIKIYPGLGFDFTQVKNKNKNLGIYPVSGKGNSYAGNETTNGLKQQFQDENVELYLWSATLMRFYDANYARAVQFTSGGAPMKNEKYMLNLFLKTRPYIANQIRCISDPNFKAINEFATQYIPAEKRDYTEGLSNPNSYIIQEGMDTLVIPVNKAYSVYNQYLTNRKWPKGSRLYANVTWAKGSRTKDNLKNANNVLVKTLKIIGNNENAKILVGLNSTNKGNAVISLHIGENGNKNDTIFWSWHLWSPYGNPSDKKNIFTYVNQPVIKKGNKSLINYTETLLFPLTSYFMDRDLGALYALPSNLKDPLHDTEEKAQILESGGLHYQWGRKDPFPSLRYVGWSPSSYIYGIYEGNTDASGNVTYPIFKKNLNLNLFYTKQYEGNIGYKNEAGVTDADPIQDKVTKILKYATQHPNTFLYTKQLRKDDQGMDTRDWLSEVRNIGADRWGHGAKKSPFDPCPEGWRVPDQSFNYHSRVENNVKGGSSSWYYGWDNKKDYLQNSLHSVETYNGQTVNDNMGVIFDSLPYSIGNYPVNLIRGWSQANPYDEAFRIKVSGFWSSTMAESGGVFAEFLIMNNDLSISPAYVLSAQMGADVRCVKDMPGYQGIKPPKNAIGGSFVEPVVPNPPEGENPKPVITESQITLYPNPTRGLFNVKLDEIKSGRLKVIHFNTGNVLINKTFVKTNKITVNIQMKPSGIYIIQIEVGNQVVNKKILKR